MEQPTSGGEAVACAQGVGVIGGQHPLAIGQSALVQRDRLGVTPGHQVGAGQAAGRAQGVGVLGAQHPLVIGEPSIASVR